MVLHKLKLIISLPRLPREVVLAFKHGHSWKCHLKGKSYFNCMGKALSLFMREPNG